MKVAIERKTIVGNIYTKFGVFPLLNENVVTDNNSNLTIVNVIDSEGFANYITISEEFIIVPLPLPIEREVRVVLTDEEAQGLENIYDDGTREGEALELKPEDITFDLRIGA